VVVHYEPGVTTMANLAALLVSSSYVILTGAWTGSDTIASGDAFGGTALSGGTTAAPVGTGAWVLAYDGHPVWDRRLENAGTIADSIQAMTEILDMDGVPFAIGTADFPDWGRAVAIESNLQSEWQWFKLFMSTVLGRQRAFWLATWRDDLTYVSNPDATIVVSSTDGSDLFAWWPAQRQHIQILQADGTLTHLEIAGATDNGDGTITLDVIDLDGEGFGYTLSDSAVTMISWLELCRWESDSYDVTFTGASFAAQLVARVVRA